MSQKQILQEAIAGNEEILAELNDFAENEGHPNAQVMLAVCGKISQLKKEISQMEIELKQLDEIADNAKSKCACNRTPYIDTKCESCLKALIAECNGKINELQKRICDVYQTIDEAAYFLELWQHGEHPEQVDG